jgi:hypothetical protein
VAVCLQPPRVSIIPCFQVLRVAQFQTIDPLLDGDWLYFSEIWGENKHFFLQY